MKKFFKKIRKHNNKGMTLIELMIAVAILSVAIIPLMNAFVNSMRYSAKGRELQQTTVLAQTIMEKCKSYTVQELDTKILDHTFLASTTVSADGTKIPMTDASTLWGLGAGAPGTDEKYYFIGGVHLENHTYDVALKIQSHDRYDYYNNVAGHGVYSDMVYTESMNKYMDAVFTVNTLSGYEGDDPRYSVAGLDFEAYNASLEMISEKIKEAAAANPGIVEEVNVPYDVIANRAGNDLKVYRCIEIVANSDGSGRDVVTVTYTYTFKLDGGVFDYVYRNPGGSPIQLSVDLGTAEIPLYNYSFYIYDNAATMSNGAHLENIYFFYYPAYSGGVTDYPIENDEITINNNTGRQINFHLVKQKNPVYSDTELNTLEDSFYSPDINASGDIVLYHNLNQNLGGATMINQIEVILPGVFDIGSLYGGTNKKLMYDIEVSIYPANSFNGSYIVGGAQPILTLNGTMLDW